MLGGFIVGPCPREFRDASEDVVNDLVERDDAVRTVW
jgi:hypothetical protein